MVEIVGIEWFEVRAIRVPEEAVEVDQSLVERLTQSIEEVGQLQLAAVESDGTLVFGRARLEALRSTGQKRAQFLVVEVPDEYRELARIDEDLVRRHLPALEQCELLARRQQIVAELGWLDRQTAGRPSTDPDVHSKYSVKQLADDHGVSPRTYFRRIRIATEICREARDLLRSTDVANSQRQLERLSSLDEKRQVAVAKVLANDEAGTLNEALSVLRSRRRSRSRKPTEYTAGPHRVLVADPEDIALLVPNGSVDLVATYVPEATLVGPIWDLDSLPNYTRPVISMHRMIGDLAAHALAKTGSLMVMVCPTAIRSVVAAIDPRVRHHSTLPFIEPYARFSKGGKTPDWRAVLRFCREEPEHDLSLEAGRERVRAETLWFEDILEGLSLPGQVVLDPFGHFEIAGATVCSGRTYVGCEATAEDAEELVGWVDYWLREATSPDTP